MRPAEQARVQELLRETEPARQAAEFKEMIADIDQQLARNDLRWEERTALYAKKEQLFIENGASTRVVGCDGVLRYGR